MDWLFGDVESHCFLGSTGTCRNDIVVGTDEDDMSSVVVSFRSVKLLFDYFLIISQNDGEKEPVRAANCEQQTSQIIFGPLSSIFSAPADNRSHSFKLTTCIECTNTGRVTEKESVLQGQRPRQQKSQTERRTDVRKIPFHAITLQYILID